MSAVPSFVQSLSASRRLYGQAALLVAAVAGGAALSLTGAPAGWISGAMIGATLVAALGLATPFAAILRNATIVLTGTVLGSGASPQALSALARYPASLAIMAAAIVAMTASAYAVLVRSPGFSRKTALYAAVPGALSYVLVASAAAGADVPRVIVVQALRIFILMALVPIFAALWGVRAAPIASAFDPVATTAVLLALAVAFAYLLARRRIASGPLYAAIAVSILAHGLGLAPGRPAPAIQIVAQVLVGAWVGARFVGFDWRLLHRLLLTALSSFFASIAAAAVFAAIAASFVKAPFMEVLVAFAPGGLEAMVMIAFALNLDPLYVGAHHLARFFFITLAMPFSAQTLGRRDEADPSP
jgi:membrane AbrB-like protein